MNKWKCDICGDEFSNFHAEGFDKKIYCPLCFYKHEFNTLNKGIDELIEKYIAKAKEYDKYIELEPMDLYQEFIQDLKKLKGD